MRIRHQSNAALFVLLLGGFLVSRAWAAPFTPGNLAVYRNPAVGTNSEQNPSAVFIDEYTTAGTLVQSIALPTSASGANAALIGQDDSDFEGMINRSTNGQYLIVTGYNQDLATAPLLLSQTDAASVPRTIGRIAADGVPDTTTTYNDSGTGSPRSAISDNGINFWISQGSVGGDMTPDGGVRTTTFGSSTSSLLSADSTDTRNIDIFGGNLYVSSATTGLNGILQVDTTTGAMTGLNSIPGGITAANTAQFFLADLSEAVEGVDTAYVADSRNQASGGGLHKYSLVEGTWIETGGVFGAQPAGQPPVSVLRGLTGVVDELGTVTLYGTRNASTNDGQLLKFVDSSGYNGSMSGTAQLLVQVTDNYFKGIDFVPVAAVGQPGDHNNDGVVDAADYVTWRKTDGTNPQGYDEFVENFGEGSLGSGQLAASGVPEPALIAMAAVAALVLIVTVRRQRPQLAHAPLRHAH